MKTSLRADAQDIVGNVDTFSLSKGVSGWALDRSRPLEPQTLCLRLGAHEIARTTTAMVREDVDALEGVVTSGVGFFFEPEALFGLADLKKETLAEPLAVHVVGRDAPLPCAPEIPDATAALAEIGAVAARLSLAGKALQFADLDEALDNLENEARVYTRISSDGDRRQVGVLETFHRLEQDTYLIVGWTSLDSPDSFPATVVQDQRWSAGVVIAKFDRDDLPEGGCGFIGMMRSRWTPQRRGAKFTLGYQVDGQGGYLAVLDGANVDARSRADIDRLADRKMEVCHDKPLLQSIRRHIGEDPGWTPSDANSTTQFHLDDLLLVPGFGFLARGWMLNGPKQLQTLQIRAGERVARMYKPSLQRFARPDLSQGFPWAGAEVDQAGFTCALRGEIGAGDISSVQIRAVYADGSTYVRDVDLWRVSVLQDLRGVAALETFYRQIQAEPFFADLRAALWRVMQHDIVTATETPVIANLAATPTLAIHFTRSVHDISAVMDQLRDQAADWPSGARLLLLCETPVPRTLLQTWQQDLAKAGFGAVHMVPVGPGFGLRRLAELQKTLPMTRFAWIRAGAVPHRAGWARILAHLSGQGAASSPDAHPEILGTARATMGQPRDEDRVALLWQAGPFLDWIATEPLRFAGTALSGLPDTMVSVPDAGFVILRDRATRFLGRLDSDINLEE